MAKMKTVLGFFVVLLLAGNAFSQLRPGLRRPNGLARPLGAASAAQEEVQSGTPGVTAPFVPFDEKDKIKYEDAVERAKKNDSEAFYWLAYYFINGEGVEKNREAAGKFLQKAVDACNAKACYLAGVYHENHNICDNKWNTAYWGSDILSWSEKSELRDTLNKAGITNGHECTLPIPVKIKRDIVPGLGKRYCSYTNEVATGYVIGLYSIAIKGGLTYATNDIARMQRTIAKCRERIAAETEAKAKGADALSLLVDEDTKKTEAAKQKEDEERRRQYEKEREYWATWPNAIDDDTQLISEVEKKFNCVFRPHAHGTRPLFTSHGELVSSNNTWLTNTWFRENGKSLIVNLGNGTFQKIDSEGRIVAWGVLHNRTTDLKEFKWYEEEKEKRIKLLRTKWAQERGMPLEEAIQKHKKWTESNPRPGLLRPGLQRPGGLFRPGLSRPGLNQEPTGLEIARARREERLKAEAEQQRQAAEQAKKMREQERKERELAAEERRAQLAQLMKIKEELRRQREQKQHEQNNNK